MRQRASEMVRERLGVMIDAVREHHGLSKTDLARKCNVGRMTVDAALRGCASTDAAIEILSRLGVRIELRCSVAGDAEPLDVIQAWDGGQR